MPRYFTAGPAIGKHILERAGLNTWRLDTYGVFDSANRELARPAQTHDIAKQLERRLNYADMADKITNALRHAKRDQAFWDLSEHFV